MHCYGGRHRIRDLVLAVCLISVCSCHLRRCDLREYCRRVSYWENGNIRLDEYVEVSCYQDIISDPGGNMPAQ